MTEKEKAVFTELVALAGEIKALAAVGARLRLDIATVSELAHVEDDITGQFAAIARLATPLSVKLCEIESGSIDLLCNEE